MTTKTEITVVERIYQLLEHLGIKQAYIAGRARDWPDLAVHHPNLFASLTLVLPEVPDPETLSHFDSNLLIFTGEQEDEYAMRLREATQSVPGISLVNLDHLAAWSDVVADNTEQMAKAILPFLAKDNRPECVEITERDGERGEIAILQSNSPSCGSERTYDGTFTETSIPGNGITAELLAQKGIKVYNEKNFRDNDLTPENWLQML